MLWVLIVLLAMAGNAGAQASTPARTDGARPTQRSTQPTPKLLSAAMPSSAEDRAAERARLVGAVKEVVAALEDLEGCWKFPLQPRSLIKEECPFSNFGGGSQSV